MQLSNQISLQTIVEKMLERHNTMPIFIKSSLIFTFTLFDILNGKSEDQLNIGKYFDTFQQLLTAV